MPLEVIFVLLVAAIVSNVVLLVAAVRVLHGDEIEARTLPRIEPRSEPRIERSMPALEAASPPRGVSQQARIGPVPEPASSVSSAARPIDPLALWPATRRPADGTAASTAPVASVAAVEVESREPGPVPDAPPEAAAPNAERPVAPASTPAPPASTPPPAPAPRPTPRRTGARGGRGRRFTLPPIDVDHARTERVVLSLLGSDEATGPGGPMVDAWERLVGPDAAVDGDRSATVVALTLEGLDRLVETDGRDTGERFVAATLDAIRRSARASDRVASVGRGHFRALLVDADDAVATQFVTRVRGALDRRLAMSPSPLRIAAGWSEARGAADLEAAVRVAEERRRADASPRRRQSGDGSPA